MDRKSTVKKAAAFAGLLTAAQTGGAVYLYRRTMIRGRARTERTIKMAGTDWNQYIPFIEERKAAMMAQPHEDVYINSDDGLKLHATWFPAGDVRKVVVCFHGYTGSGLSDFAGLTGYYRERGFSMLLADERAHGESGGTCIGFGCLDRYDVKKWVEWTVDRCGQDARILLHGISMGGAAVLMSSGLKLPPQVKGIVSDCGFTSAKEVFAHVLRSTYHLPPFPMLWIADGINRRYAGYGLDECNAAREVRRAKVPILLIHGSADTFVPCGMCDVIYDNCAAPKRKLIVEGAAHAESYYKDRKAYEKALDQLIYDSKMAG